MRTLLALVCAVALPACGGESAGPTGATPTGDPVLVHLKHRVGDAPLEFDSAEYVNAAGNQYTVSRLEYYVSGFVFQMAGGHSHPVGGAFYVNAADPATAEIDLGPVPSGDYVGLTLFAGLDSKTNINGGLDNTKENVDMAWPDQMGGGYHFLKLEGHYKDPSMMTSGFAMHLGGNETLVTVAIEKPFHIAADSPSLTLAMDLNEWFDHPHVFDFDADGNYTMHDAVAKQTLKENGADVFTMDE